MILHISSGKYARNACLRRVSIKPALSGYIIIDAAGAVARQTKNVLEKEGLLIGSVTTEGLAGDSPILSTVSHDFYSNSATDVLKSFIPTAPHIRLHYSTEF